MCGNHYGLMKFYNITYCDPERFDAHQSQFYAVQSDNTGAGKFIEINEDIPPEDVLFGRKLSFVWDIPDLIFFIHANGDEELSVVTEDFENWDEYHNRIIMVKQSIVIGNNDKKAQTV